MTAWYFVTGTDTGVGKTQVAVALLRAAVARGLNACGFKPVAAGGEIENGRWVNEDARQLQQAASATLDYAQVNPVMLPEPIAPHIAAAHTGIRLSANDLVRQCRSALPGDADIAVVEGAGGWLVPLNGQESLADVCAGLGAGVVLVVGMRLGCLNHALLTAAAIRARGLVISGWIANCIDPSMQALAENIATLERRFTEPYLGTVPHADTPGNPAHFERALNFGALFDTLAAADA